MNLDFLAVIARRISKQKIFGEDIIVCIGPKKCLTKGIIKWTPKKTKRKVYE